MTWLKGENIDKEIVEKMLDPINAEEYAISEDIKPTVFWHIIGDLQEPLQEGSFKYIALKVRHELA